MWSAKLITINENGNLKPSHFQQIFVRLLTIKDIRQIKLGTNEAKILSSLIIFKNPLAKFWFIKKNPRFYQRLIDYSISKSSRQATASQKSPLSVEINRDYQDSQAVELLLRKNGYTTNDILNLSPIERENILSTISHLNDQKIKMRFKPISHTIKLEAENA